jgi:hypothetical protein
MIGGSACEYYPKSNCGLLTYFAVKPEFRRKYAYATLRTSAISQFAYPICRGVARFLVEKVLCTLNGDAKNSTNRLFGPFPSLLRAVVLLSIEGGKSGLSALFLETNDANKVDATKDVIDPRLRHQILQRLGEFALSFSFSLSLSLLSW